MTAQADPQSARFEVLHALVIKGMTGPGPLTACTGLDDHVIVGTLDQLRAAGLASHQPARDLWRLSAAGREQHARLLDEDVPAGLPGLRPAHARFLPLNTRLKELCLRWQVRGGAPNDHGDAAYDQARIAELGALHPEAAGVIAELAAVRDRFGRYSRRLSAALDRVRGGEPAAFTGVRCDSYHDVWMELHRDLLLSLRIGREAEEAGEAGAEAAAGSAAWARR
jgi:hypothetical protein